MNGVGIKAGCVIHGPDGQGYCVTRTPEIGDLIKAADFAPFGGAPEPKDGDDMPPWLRDWLAGMLQ